MLLETVALNRAKSEEGPDNLWAMTLKTGRDQRVYPCKISSHRGEMGPRNKARWVPRFCTQGLGHQRAHKTT